MAWEDRWELFVSHTQLGVAGWMSNTLLPKIDESHRYPLIVAIGQGGFQFADDIERHLKGAERPYLRVNVHVSSYQGEERSEPTLESFDALSRALQFVRPSRTFILIVDDICDSGHTLKAVESVVLGLAPLPTGVVSAVAVQRIRSDQVFTPTWHLWEYEGDEFLCGYGMDSGEPDATAASEEYTRRDTRIWRKKINNGA